MNIFKNLMVKIQNFIKKEEVQKENSNYSELDKINFYNDKYYINDKQYSITNLAVVYYGVAIFDDEDIRYYLVLQFDIKTNNTFNEGYELVDIDSFTNAIKKANILAIPTINNSGVYTVDEMILSIEYTSIIYEKYLVSIYYNTLGRKNFSLKNISIEDLLERPRKYISTNTKDDTKFHIKILSHKLTLNRGYGMYPLLNNEIITDDIFYSFDEDEIKTKIIELFDKYSV